jgi:hypothetical protein
MNSHHLHEASVESLFSKLFRAGSSERDRLEDYLTELFADLLGRLPHAEQLAFCEEFLLPKEHTPDKQMWITRAKNCQELIWKTQVRAVVPGSDHPKRPDIALFDEKGPILVVECKIGARFTVGDSRDDIGDRRMTVDQLVFYDKWLIAESGRNTALILLTHLVGPPIGFLSPEGTYKTSLRSVRRWADVYNWLIKSGFLEEQELMSENPSLSDFAAARLYLCGGSYGRTVEALTIARKEVYSRFSKLDLRGFPNQPPRLESWPTSGWISDWCQPANSPSVGWGIYFVREDSDEWNEYEPLVAVFEGAYVNVEFSNPVQRPKTRGFEHWHFPTWKHEKGEPFEVYIVVPLSELAGDFSTSFSTWVSDQFDNALKLIAAVTGKESGA